MKKQEIIEAVAVQLADMKEPGGYMRFPIFKVIDAKKRTNPRFTSCVAGYITAKIVDYDIDGKVYHQLVYYMNNGSTVEWNCNNLTKQELIDLYSAIINRKRDEQKIYVVMKTDATDFVEDITFPIITPDRNKAVEFFKQEVKSAKKVRKEYGLSEQEQSEDHYACWEEGCYVENHISISILEKFLVK